MRYHVYCNLKSISDHKKAAISEFEKRLTGYCDITLTCLSSLFLPKDTGKKHHHILFLDTGLSTYSSESFAKYLQQLPLSGISTLHVLIGFNESDIYKALESVSEFSMPERLALSPANLSTETSTLLFYEQLYRGYTILAGKTYHK